MSQIGRMNYWLSKLKLEGEKYVKQYNIYGKEIIVIDVYKDKDFFKKRNNEKIII